MAATHEHKEYTAGQRYDALVKALKYLYSI